MTKHSIFVIDLATCLLLINCFTKAIYFPCNSIIFWQSLQVWRRFWSSKIEDRRRVFEFSFPKTRHIHFQWQSVQKSKYRCMAFWIDMISENEFDSWWSIKKLWLPLKHMFSIFFICKCGSLLVYEWREVQMTLQRQKNLTLTYGFCKILVGTWMFNYNNRI